MLEHRKVTSPSPSPGPKKLGKNAKKPTPGPKKHRNLSCSDPGFSKRKWMHLMTAEKALQEGCCIDEQLTVGWCSIRPLSEARNQRSKIEVEPMIPYRRN